MENNILHRKQSIIFTAIDVMNDFGIQGVSTKKIAKRQGIAESTIFKHFKTKKDVILAVLDYYSQFDADIIISAQEQSNNPLEAIELFIKAYAEYYENYPAITAITVSYEAFQYQSELADKVNQMIHNRESFIEMQMEKAQTSKYITHEVDSSDLTNMILGTFLRLCLKWRINSYNFSLKEKTLANLQMIFQCFKA